MDNKELIKAIFERLDGDFWENEDGELITDSEVAYNSLILILENLNLTEEYKSLTRIEDELWYGVFSITGGKNNGRN